MRAGIPAGDLKCYLRSTALSCSFGIENPLERPDDLRTLHLGAFELKVEREVAPLGLESEDEVLRAPASRLLLAPQAPGFDTSGSLSSQTLHEGCHFLSIALSNYLQKN
jgi:hypothetical protein